MQLTLTRKWFTDISTVGVLLVDGANECFTIERPWMDGANTPEIAAILEGTYDVVMLPSQHFNKDMMHLSNVPGRTDVMIHNANWASQLKGCVAVGRTKSVDAVGASVEALGRLTDKVVAALTAGDRVTITISNSPVQA